MSRRPSPPKSYRESLAPGDLTASGGLKACAWADLIQGSALILGGGVVMVIALDRLGATPVVAALASRAPIPPTLTDAARGSAKTGDVFEARPPKPETRPPAPPNAAAPVEIRARRP